MVTHSRGAVNGLRERRLYARKGDDYDNAIDGWQDDDEDPRIAQVIDWLQALTEHGATYTVWVKDRNQHHVGGYFTTAQITRLVKAGLAHSGTAVGVHFSINPVNPALRSNADHQLDRAIGAPKATDVVRRRLMVIDIDPCREADISATDEEKNRAEARMREVAKFLKDRGWAKPAIVDSGNGFYLLYRIDLPSDDNGLVHGVLKSLQQQFADKHVDIDTTVANAGRVVKIPGTMACKGKSTVKRPHRRSRVIELPRGGLQIVSREQLEEVACKSPTANAGGQSPSSEHVASAVVKHASAYLAKIPLAISGQHGHDATLSAANAIVVGFDFSHDSDAAWQLMQEFNQRCDPPWSDKDLRRKLSEADRLACENNITRGWLRSGEAAELVPGDWAPFDGEDFLIEIPDYYPVSAEQVQLPIRRFGRRSPWYGLQVYLAWKLQRSAVPIPDVVARQVQWGARRLKAWRRPIVKATTKFKWEAECPDYCPLHGSGIPHKHFVPSKKCLNGDLEYFTNETFETWQTSGTNKIELPRALLKQAHRIYQHASDDKHTIRLRALLKKKGRIYQCYYPVFIFGRSHPVGLSASQVRLMMGITHELTRIGPEMTFDQTTRKPSLRRAHSIRADRAELIARRKVAPSGDGSHKIVCRLLDDEKQYVVFGGNLRRHHGKGYPILPNKGRCWLDHAGYEKEEYTKNPWAAVKSFLDDIAGLAEMFDLVVAARHHGKREWKSLAELRECLKTGYGKDWLRECTLRIFAPADYLVRWRYMLARRLGFRWIPGGEECPIPALDKLDDGQLITNGAQLRAWLDRRGWTTSRFAIALDLSRETVSRHLSNRRNSPKFWKSVNTLIQELSKKPLSKPPEDAV